MPLTEQQIQQLFEFTKKKMVHHYDLQIELVDHLAESIEEEICKNLNVSFEEALQTVYKRFGLFGFAKVVQEKQQSLLQQNKMIWKEAVRTFLTIPKVFLSLSIFMVAYYTAEFISVEWRTFSLLLIWIVLIAVHIICLKKIKIVKDKRLMLTETIYLPEFGGFTIPWLIIHITIFFDVHLLVTPLLFASVVTLVIILELAIIEMKNFVREKAKQLYPQAFA